MPAKHGASVSHRPHVSSEPPPHYADRTNWFAPPLRPYSPGRHRISPSSTASVGPRPVPRAVAAEMTTETRHKLTWTAPIVAFVSPPSSNMRPSFACCRTRTRSAPLRPDRALLPCGTLPDNDRRCLCSGHGEASGLASPRLALIGLCCWFPATGNFRLVIRQSPRSLQNFS